MNDPVAAASATLAGQWRADAASTPIDRRHRLLDAVADKWSHGRRAPTENALAYDPQYCNAFIQDAIAVVYHSARWTHGAKTTTKTTTTLSPPKTTVSNNRPTSATSVRRRTLVDNPIKNPIDVATMVYRAPMFQAPHLQALEAETYSLLDATDVRYKHRLPRGPGLSAARLHSATSRRQRPQSAGITRPRPKDAPKRASCRRLEQACRVIYTFVCKHYLLRKLQRISKLEDRRHAAARRLQVWYRRRRQHSNRNKSPTRTRLRAKKPKLRRRHPPPPEPVRQRQKTGQRAPRDIEAEAINTYLLARLLARPGDPRQKKKPPRKPRPLCRFRHPSRYLAALIMSSVDIVTVLMRCAPRVAIPAYVLSARTALAVPSAVDDTTASTPILNPSSPDDQPVSVAPAHRVFATADRLQLMLFREKSQATLQQCLDILADDASESTASDVRDAAESPPNDDDDDSTPRLPVLLRRNSSLPCLAMQCNIADAAASTIQRAYGQYCRRQTQTLAAERIQRQYRVHVVRADIRLGLKTLRAQHRRTTRKRAASLRPQKTRGWSTLYLVLRLQQILHRRVAKWRQSQRAPSTKVEGASMTAVMSIQRWYRHWKVAPTTIAVDDPPPPVSGVDDRDDDLVDDYAIAITPLAASPVRLPNDDAANWATAIDADGNAYYFNTMTRETTWDPPRGWQPPTWDTCVDTNGTVYYYNRTTNESVWELPSTHSVQGCIPTNTNAVDT
ncbi:hypothetical protein SDRG_03986 [Saprolegnia diclina VS20]|uniref:WW domain-containing protein n=1 Tax=Saprolegnia diclina (strain VS20) TaxID=1156394 RepID=T0QLV8_SAPDV|nr:hypothetical protein SDRG_03986 [Saprolegnia diclina VS20]EQC39034.1 hypothetical protein SDRG_03986 [Saprolegnia diclina VS20]|eukprot:XP_008607858.1 hypothetical protein SDRG_03986 [Saprolegnia diclina VS20]